jgi:hypothetical protein
MTSVTAVKSTFSGIDMVVVESHPGGQPLAQHFEVQGAGGSCSDFHFWSATITSGCADSGD